MTTTRRTFIISVAATSATLITSHAFAQVKLDENGPQAIALGYVNDSVKTDGKKYPKHANTQMCSNCALWQSKTTDAWGNCPLFAGKQVNAKGWCSAWAKKA
jgi:hypothetical protein